MTTTVALRGGAWLTEDIDQSTVLTPERLTEEHRLIRRTADDFIDNEVLTVLERLDQKDWSLARALLVRCGNLGLLGTDVPEALGGVELDRAAAVVVGESVGRCASFATTFGAQTGLAVTPLLCFGSDDQQRKYVPRLISGELVGAYALSEAGSGSDARSARARASRQLDGSFLLTGEKMWITNGGFADLFIVFAKVVNQEAARTGAGELTAFVVERGFEGVSCGAEEHKMGLHASSTTPLILQEARVPADNVLGEIGKGYRVAFNVLNYGRLKLGAMCSGGAKRVIGEGARYAAGRRQFGQPIASFGAVRQKLADMAIREYAVEAMLYRTSGLLDRMLQSNDAGSAALAALEEFAVEASILKVAGSEMLDFVVDENVQIHGGNGFVRDYPAERHYRDARVNRIFEGTNEINRLLVPTLLARRAVKGMLPIVGAAKRLQDELPSPAIGESAGGGSLEAAQRTVTGMKKVAVMVLGSAMDTYGTNLSGEQEVLTRAADIIIDVYGADSALLRATAAASPLHDAAAQVFVNDAAWRVALAARDALAATVEGDMLEKALAALRRLLNPAPVNTIALRRQVAEAVVDRSGYPF